MAMTRSTLSAWSQLPSLQGGGQDRPLLKGHILWVLGALQESYARLEDDSRALRDSLFEAGVLPVGASLELRAHAYQCARVANTALCAVASMRLLSMFAGNDTVVRFAMTSHSLRTSSFHSSTSLRRETGIRKLAKSSWSTSPFDSTLSLELDGQILPPKLAKLSPLSNSAEAAKQTNTTECIPSLDELLMSLDVEDKASPVEASTVPEFIQQQNETLLIDASAAPGSQNDVPVSDHGGSMCMDEQAVLLAEVSPSPSTSISTETVDQAKGNTLPDSSQATPSNFQIELDAARLPKTWQEKKLAAKKALESLARWQTDQIGTAAGTDDVPSSATQSSAKNGEPTWHGNMAQKLSEHEMNRLEVARAAAAEQAFRDSVQEAAVEAKVREDKLARKRKKAKKSFCVVLGSDDEVEVAKNGDQGSDGCQHIETPAADMEAGSRGRRRGGAFSKIAGSAERPQRVAPAKAPERVSVEAESDTPASAVGPEDTLHINVRMAVTGEKLAKLTVQGSDIVQDLREAAQQSWSEDGLLQVSFEEAILEDDLRICDTGLYDYATVFVERRPPLYVVTSSADETARIWRIANGKFAELHGHHSQVQQCSFAHSDAKVLTASVDGTAKIWSSVTGLCEWTLTGHRNQVLTAVFSRDDELVLTASADRTARLWSVEDGTCSLILEGHRGSVTCAQFSPNGAQVVTTSTDETVRLWRTDTGECMHTCVGHQHHVLKASFSCDGSRLISTCIDGPPRLWSASNAQCVAVLDEHFGPTLSGEFSPDGSKVVTGGSDGVVRIWTVHTAACLHALRGHNTQIISVEFAPHGLSVASSAADSTARLWDVSSGQCLRILKGHADAVHQVSFSHDGWMLVTSSADGTARVWSTESGKCSRVFKGHRSAVLSVQFSHR